MTIYIAEARHPNRNVFIGYFQGDLQLIRDFITLNYDIGCGLEVRQIRILTIDKEKFDKQKELIEQKKLLEKQLTQIDSQLRLYKV
jgi:hypothetical protein